MKFLHAADLHLDSPLKGLPRYEGAPVESVRGAARRALENLVGLAIDEQVHFLVIAGDVYDGDWRDYQTGLFFTKQMSKLADAGIPVVLISGNHDAQNQMTRSLRLPQNVKTLSADRPESHWFEDHGAVVHGQSYARRDVTEDLSASYPSAVPGWFNIGLLHTALTGREGHDPYAPCTIDGLRAREYDYWALGHIHQREQISVPGGGPEIHFAGNLQGRHARETGAKGCLLVERKPPGGRVCVRFTPLDVMRWHRVSVDVSELGHPDEAIDSAIEELARLAETSEVTAAVRLELRGTTSAHAGLQADSVHLLNEIRNQVIQRGQGRIWLEKVLLRTRSPIAVHREDPGPIGELLGLIDDLRDDRQELRRMLKEQLEPLARKLPNTAWRDSLLKQGMIDDGTSLGRGQIDLDPSPMLTQVESLLLDRLQDAQDGGGAQR